MGASIEDKLFLDRFNVDETSHLNIIDGAVCVDDCEQIAVQQRVKP